MGSLLSAQNYLPHNNCSGAPLLSLQGLMYSTAGYSAGDEPVNTSLCPDYPSIYVLNDNWVAFVPQKEEVVFKIRSLNDSCKVLIVARLHEDCNETMTWEYVCGEDSITIGKGRKFKTGKTYYLQLAPVYSICPFKISYYPEDALYIPPTPVPKIPLTLNSMSNVPCPNKLIICSAPLSFGTAYHWKIESGKAEIINDYGVEYVDISPLKDKTEVIVTGPARHIVRLHILGQDSVKVSVESLNGIYSTGKAYKTIKVGKAPTLDNLNYVCNASGTSYKVVAKISGNAPFKTLYNSNKGYFIGDTYTSYPIIAGKRYDIFIGDNQDCEPLHLSGSYLCPEYTTSIFQPKNDVQLIVYPNPAQHSLSLFWTGMSNPISYSIMDLTGRVVQENKIDRTVENLQISITDLLNGLYYIRLQFKDIFLQEKLMIMKE